MHDHVLRVHTHLVDRRLEPLDALRPDRRFVAVEFRDRREQLQRRQPGIRRPAR